MNKASTIQLKGIAIFMMVLHHTLGFPMYWEDATAANTVPEAVLPFFSTSLKICVAVFAFISGYGFSKSKDFSAKKQIYRASRLLKVYWSQLLFIFFPIFIFGGGIITPLLVFNNLFAFNDQLIIFSWYVYFYLFVLLIMPFVRRLLDKGLVISLIIAFVGCYGLTIVFYFASQSGNIYLKDLLDCSTYFPIVCIGYICGKYLLIEKTSKVFTNPVVSIVIVIAVLFFRRYLSVYKGFSFDIFYAPIFCAACYSLLSHSKYISKAFMILGNVSTEMWFLHSLFFWKYSRTLLQQLFVIPSPIVSVLIVLLLSYVFAWVYSFVFNQVSIVLKRITSSKI